MIVMVFMIIMVGFILSWKIQIKKIVHNCKGNNNIMVVFMLFFFMLVMCMCSLPYSKKLTKKKGSYSSMWKQNDIMKDKQLALAKGMEKETGDPQDLMDLADTDLMKMCALLFIYCFLLNFDFFNDLLVWRFVAAFCMWMFECWRIIEGNVYTFIKDKGGYKRTTFSYWWYVGFAFLSLHGMYFSFF